MDEVRASLVLPQHPMHPGNLGSKLLDFSRLLPTNQILRRQEYGRWQVRGSWSGAPAHRLRPRRLLETNRSRPPGLIHHGPWFSTRP